VTFTKTPSNQSGVRSKCKVCFGALVKTYREQNPDLVRERARAHREKARDTIKARQAEWHAANRGRQREKSLRWAKENPERHRQKSARWAKDNPDYTRAKSSARYHRKKDDPAFALRLRVSRAMRHSLSGGKQGRGWESLVGYTYQELRVHLERQFLKGMSWENMGEWHIDHIVPLSSFTISGPNDPELRRAWALPNLRPLWAADNLRKSAQRVSLL
jgi:hypothetical protein